jgi:excinuclease UvrABC ATPase subunit
MISCACFLPVPARHTATTPEKKMVKFSEEEIVQNLYSLYDGKKITMLAPLVRGRKGHYRELFEEIRKTQR